MITRRLLFGMTVAVLSAAGKSTAPLLFLPNGGQAPADVRYVVRGSHLTAYFRPDRLSFHAGKVDIGVEFEGADPEGRIEGQGRTAGKANFLIGEEANWLTDVPLYGGIVYRDLYPGIDLAYGAHGRNLKSEFIVAPGANPARIRMRYTGIDRITVDRQGGLRISAGGREWREDAPLLYQNLDGGRTVVSGAFTVTSDGAVGFTVKAYDHSAPLIIDPILYSTYLGGSNSDAAMSVAADNSGAAYIAGFTASLDFPRANPQQNFNAGSNDAFVAKLSPSGDVVYCTYLGGSLDDRASGIAVDAAGQVYLTGMTSSKNFPLLNPLQPKMSGTRNGFVSKLNAAGNGLVFSTYLGGNGTDAGNSIAIDSSANIFVAGSTASSNFPTTGLQRVNRGSQDAFVAKVSADGGRLLYSTYIGGSYDDCAAGIAVDTAGAAYITGWTYSADFPVVSSLQAQLNGAEDAFVAKVSADGDSLLFSTFLGGSGGAVGTPEEGRGIAVDEQGSAYVTGTTPSQNFPVLHPIQAARLGATDAFAAKLSAAGALVYSTYLGGSGMETANAIAVDATGNTYIGGTTTSADFPTARALQTASGGGYDAFFAKINAAGDSLALASYLGGNGSDTATAVAADATNIYLAGWTLSTNFPLVGAFQGLNSGTYGAFVAKIGMDAPPAVDSVTPSSGTGASQTFRFQFSDANGAAALETVQALVNTTPSTAGACAVTYNVAANTLSLLTDAGTPPATAITPGSGNQQNSQCSLSGAGSSVSQSGNTLTLTLAIVFQGAFAGSKNVYGQAASGSGSSGWQLAGTWTVSTPPPSAVSVTPASGSGSAQTFAFEFTDARGYAAISTASVIIHATLSGAGSCYLYYSRTANTVYLANDAGTAWLAPKALGQSGSLQNSQCGVDAGASSASGSGNNLTVNLALTFQPAFTGSKNIYMEVFDGQDSGWQLKGAWTVATTGPPSAVSVTPASGSGASQTFTFVYSDPRGYSAISTVSMIINGTLSANGACYLYYSRAANTISLANDTATAWVSSLQPGQSGTIQNSQCAVNAAASSAAGSGTNLTLALALTFQPAFNGTKNVYMEIYDGQDSGWQQKGSWTVSATASLGPVSVSPASGAGTSQTFSFVFTDPKGYASIASASVIIAATLSGSGSCYLYYAPSKNAIYLANDTASAWVGSKVLGQSGTLQNSQCSVDPSGSSAFGSGNDLTVNLALSFLPSFTGAKKVYMEVYDIQDSGWTQKGTWTVP